MIAYPSTIVGPPADRSGGLAGRPAVSPAGRLSNLRALVLLSGVVRAKGWVSEIGRSVLDLPIDSRRSLLAQWFEQAVRLAGAPHVGPFAMEVLVDRLSPMPDSGELLAALPGSGVDELRVERDSADYRGTGGVLRDLARRYEDDDYLLVATGTQVLYRSLDPLAGALAARGADVSIAGHEDGTPAGLVWVRCGCLREIPELGFIDLKEQALPQIARRHAVEVVTVAPVGASHRTPADYIAAVRQYHLRQQNQERPDEDPFTERWCPSFATIEQGAEVDPTAQVHDSVVLKGARVERNAVVIRSLVGPAGVVRRGQRAIDQFINRAGQSRYQPC